jgi:Protein of unknown function (DUF3349)
MSELRAVLSAAFPGGVPESQYLPLLAVLVERLSLRNVAELIAAHTGREWPVAYNDALAAESRSDELAAAAGEVRRLLERHGFKD